MDQNILSDKELFISRELSWLDFNSRVLDEAQTLANPLLERLKFVAIFSSNLDEFFSIRIAGLRQQITGGKETPDPAGLLPSGQLKRAKAKIERLLRRQYRCLNLEIIPELENNNIYLKRPDELSKQDQEYLKKIFINRIMPVLTPLAVDLAHPFPVLNSGAIEIAISLNVPEKNSIKEIHGFVEVPEVLGRFIEINNESDKKIFVPLEFLILEHLQLLFPGCKIKDKLPFRITRDMDFSVEDEDVDNLMMSIGRKLLQRRQRPPIRLEYPSYYHKNELIPWLKEKLNLDDEYLYSINGYLHLKQFFELIIKAKRPDLLEHEWPVVSPAAFAGCKNIFEAIDKHGDILLAPPFHSFSPVVRMLEEAATDPNVLAIKQTLYRVSGNSPIVKALQKAAEAGKQVTVVVELKARFDESNNIVWARALEESGAHVIYGIAGLKIHCKALIIVRQNPDGSIRRYVHLGTGNYNDKTATMYTDLGIFSNNSEICYDISALFNMLTGVASLPSNWRKIAVSPRTLRSKFEYLIEREITHVAAGRPGRIIAKMNSFSDEEMIRLIHKAANAGVEIDLIVRGICCYRPLKNQDNIRIISIVDRYLEHSRIFYFGNAGEPEYFLSSADWMTRNLDRRVELLFPVVSEEICKILNDLLLFQLADTDKQRRLLSSGAYTKVKRQNYSSMRSQKRSADYFKHLSDSELKGNAGEMLKVFSS